MVRLRIALADRSGALAQAATVIGLHGGNIRAIDVHRAPADAAVDDLVVDFATPPDVEAMRTDLAMNASATLLDCCTAEAVDPVEAALREVRGLMEGGRLADALTSMCGAASAHEESLDLAATTEAGRSALEQGKPVRFAGPPGEAGDGEASETGDGDGDGEPDDRDGSGAAAGGTATAGLAVATATSVIFLTRPANLGFTDTEVARVEALVAIGRAVAPRP
ncbi:MAG: hypothetical protein KGQ66_22210 [Acidobacteriota bacterium]|nr:hypothetical protein [Acidobacteriota bacterium]